MDDYSEIKELLFKLENPLPICRVCLNDTLEYIDFEASMCLIGDTEFTYFDGYNELTYFSISLDHKLPSRLCITCSDDLRNAFLFSKRVENAETTLKRLKAHLDCENGVSKRENEIVENNEWEVHVSEPVGFLETSVNVENSETQTQPLIVTESSTTSAISEIEDDSDSEWAIDKSIDPNNSLQCKDCGKICTSPESYRKHCLPHQFAKCKPKARKCIKCKQCGKTFRLYGDLEKHLLIHAMAKIKISKGKKTSYVCNTCHKRYGTVFGFVDHMHIHNGTKPYKCSTCGAFRHTREKLKYHKYYTHGKGLQLRLAIKDEKMKFMETDPLRFKTKCRYCGKLFVNEVIKRHENPKKRFRCIVCSKSFYTEQNLKFHSEIHLEVRKPLKCKICGQEILRRYSMKLHMQRHASEDQKFKCDICGTVLSTKGSLSEHKEKHSIDRKYKCEHCDKSYIKKSRLVYHTRSHTGENPFQCNQCNKSYKLRCHLRVHINVAHGNQTFDCDNCDAKFKSYSGFINHKFVHTGYPYECPQCRKGTATRERLKKHLLQVHKGYMTSEQFDETYPKKHEIRKVKPIKAKVEVKSELSL